MIRQELQQKLSTLLARFAFEVKFANSMGQYDINSIAEDFLIPILGIAFDCPDLRNLNRVKMNFPAVDLGCATSRTSIQITSDHSSAKILETLEKFERHELNRDFDKLYVYVITERQKSYSSQKLKDKADGLPISFDVTADIFDCRDLARKLENHSNEKLEHLTDHLEAEFQKKDANLQFRRNLDAFLKISQNKIEDEKRTKKYIPSVFVETSETKEEMRYFANPMFFYRKIDDDLKRINLDYFNERLAMAKIEPITGDLHVIAALEEPDGQSKLQVRLSHQRHSLEVIKELIAPFSWHVYGEERFSPRDFLTGYWEVFRLDIQSNGTGVFQSLENVLKKIEIAQAKIFLVTGMAGQGKTNFICDLVENQFVPFEIPTIFIPARSLNSHQGPDRILSYITNNRFAPNIENLHDLFTLLNNVAKECQKPFIIAIDGINEVGDLEGFVAELQVFLEALCQYDFVKIIITCRNEFFDHKFAKVFEPHFTDQLHRVQDLRGEMSEDNKSRLLDAYLRHFRIQASLSETAMKFLKNDLILLRIFCEIHERKSIGYVSNIYKGDVFEKYLSMKVQEFPTSSQQSALNSLYKICSRMLASEEFSQVSLDGFEESERKIIEQLIGEDVILRREVPSMELASLGIENISFTYDELRDFLLAYYTVTKLAVTQPAQVSDIFEKIPEWPIYEGFFRYTYILARKKKCSEVLTTCEAVTDFNNHYLNNLSLLSADIQTLEDVGRIEAVLKNSKVLHDLQRVAWFLFRKRDASEHLNVQILLDHINTLDDEEADTFIRTMFSRSSDMYDGNRQSRVNDLLAHLIKLSPDQILAMSVPALAMALHFAPHANWAEKESTLNFFADFLHIQTVRDAIESCRDSASIRLQKCLKEIAEDRATP